MVASQTVGRHYVGRFGLTYAPAEHRWPIGRHSLMVGGRLKRLISSESQWNAQSLGSCATMTISCATMATSCATMTISYWAECMASGPTDQVRAADAIMNGKMTIA